MNDEFESRLRQAFKPQAPPSPLRAKVLAALQADADQRSHHRLRLNPFAGWLSMGLAASIVAGVGWSWHVHQANELAAELEARRQVIEALRVTNDKLDLAFLTVRDQAS
jgi:hypothetical protein